MVLSVRGVHLSLSRWSCLLLEQCCERMFWHAAYLPSGARPEITIQCYCDHVSACWSLAQRRAAREYC